MAATARAPIYFVADLAGSRVDREKGIIFGVSVITGDIKAKGHDLWTDDTTLLQMKEHGDQQKIVLVKANHKDKDGKPTGIEATAGWLENFEVDGKKTRADLHLYPSFKERELVLDVAQMTPTKLGLSAAFVPPEKDTVIAGKKRARVEELISVDLVTHPAANPDGFFGFNPAVDTSPGAMADTPSTAAPAKTAEQLMQEILEGQKKITERLDSFDQRFAAMDEQAMADLSPGEVLERLQALSEQTDEQLAQQGITRDALNAEMDAAISAIAEAGGEVPSGEPAAAPAATPGVPAAPAKTTPAAPAAAPAAAGAALSALEKRLKMLEARHHAEDKAVELAEAEDARKAMVELDAKIKQLETENAALKKVQEAGSNTPLLKPGQRDAIGFEAPKGGKHDPSTFEGKVELATKDPANKGKTQSAIMLECIRAFPAEHQAWRQRGGKVQL